MRVTFREVKFYADKSVKCAGGCGRRVKRSRKFYQTVNPFNKRSDGALKTPDDIYSELEADAKKWKVEPELCTHCREGRI